MNLVSFMAPELVLVCVACALFLLGVSSRAWARRLAPVVTLFTLAAVFAWQLAAAYALTDNGADATGTFVVTRFTVYIKMLTAGVAIPLVLLAWPTNREATGNASLDFGHDAGEFFALLLLSLSGVMLVAGANDIILLFLGIELASIPTYVMVSMSRPLPVAQEAGVKYFFLGAMAAAVMLFGFSYLYGTTGMTKLNDIQAAFLATAEDGWQPRTTLTTWQLLAVVMLLAGFAFKIAAVPLHAYAGDVYQGAATPVTAFLAFVPKTSGMVAIIKLLAAVGGPHWSVPPVVVTLLTVVAGLTMTVGNVLGLLQFNVKRVLAYSSVAHSGYMLVGLAALAHAPALLGAGVNPLSRTQVDDIQAAALGGVLFYLAAYGIMNSGAFGVLMLLPSRGADYGRPAAPGPVPATTAETFDDLAGAGRRHPVLGLAMAVCCFSLIGLPLTIGFFGKFYLFQPALRSRLYGLVVVMALNAAVSAAYYLKIVAALYLRPDPGAEFGGQPAPAPASPESGDRAGWPIRLGLGLSVAATLGFGMILPATQGLITRSQDAQFVAPRPPAATIHTADATGGR